MTNENKIRLTRLIAIIAVIVALRFVDGGKAWEYMVDHVWLALLLPIVGLFVMLFWRGMSIQRRRTTEDTVKMSDPQNLKP